MSDAGGRDEIGAEVARERQRELATEHLLFWTIRFVEHRHPGLLDELEGSLDRLGDSAADGTKDDEAVRAVARRFLKGLRAQD